MMSQHIYVGHLISLLDKMIFSYKKSENYNGKSMYRIIVCEKEIRMIRIDSDLCIISIVPVY